MQTLSGGNLQKVMLARVLAQRPKVLVVAQPNRGLDVAATEYVRSKLLEQRLDGAAILLISEDLDEIMQLRIPSPCSTRAASWPSARQRALRQKNWAC